MAEVPREAVESPALGIFKSRLDTIWSNALWGTLLEQEVGLGDFCDFFQPEPLYKPKSPRKLSRFLADNGIF